MSDRSPAERDAILAQHDVCGIAGCIDYKPCPKACETCPLEAAKIQAERGKVKSRCCWSCPPLADLRRERIEDILADQEAAKLQISPEWTLEERQTLAFKIAEDADILEQADQVATGEQYNQNALKIAGLRKLSTLVLQAPTAVLEANRHKFLRYIQLPQLRRSSPQTYSESATA